MLRAATCSQERRGRLGCGRSQQPQAQSPLKFCVSRVPIHDMDVTGKYPLCGYKHFSPDVFQQNDLPRRMCPYVLWPCVPLTHGHHVPKAGAVEPWRAFSGALSPALLPDPLPRALPHSAMCPDFPSDLHLISPCLAGPVTHSFTPLQHLRMGWPLTPLLRCAGTYPHH